MSDSLSLKTEETKSIIDTANAMADAARKVILPRFRSKSLVSENKSLYGFDPVTDADKSAEKAMISELKQRRPTDGVFGEEFLNIIKTYLLHINIHNQNLHHQSLLFDIQQPFFQRNLFFL